MDDDFYKNTKFFSGEMFDETATSFNNDFGFEHNTGVLRYGINFPLSKFISELEKILDGDEDDKSSKRISRINFLYSCEVDDVIQVFFVLFCNYLNGGGTDSTPSYWAKQQYYNNYIIITAAGGNIIILFAQLIMNMLDSFSGVINGRFGKPVPMKNWNISDPGYISNMEDWNMKDWDTPERAASVPQRPVSAPLPQRPVSAPMPQRPVSAPQQQDNIEDNIKDYVKTMFVTPFQSWSSEYKSIIIDTYNSLTPTNKLLLVGLQNTPEAMAKTLSCDELCFLIVKHFLMSNIKDSTILENILSVAKSKFSDFDFKLSPNIHPSLIVDDSYPPSLIAEFTKRGLFDEKIEVDENVDSFIKNLEKNIDKSEIAGFLLFRVKTLIDNRKDYKQKFNTKELKRFQRDCAKLLGPEAWSLYPQIMQDSYFDKVPPTSECWKYLNDLAQKKETIRQATQDAIDETLKFYLAGYYKRGNIQGTTFPLVEPAINSTEAIINYISYTAYNLNIYIEHWETFVGPAGKRRKRRKHKLSKDAAPALHRGGLPVDFSHRSACYNFLSLTTILNNDKGLVARLASDIINYFLNNSMFNAENILDNLIVSFNIKKQQVSPGSSVARMPPSGLLLVTKNPIFRARLQFIQKIMDETRFSELGYPDGIRITLNAIESNDAPDKNMNNTEKNEMSNIVLNLDVVNAKRQAPSPSSSPLVSPYESDIKRQMLAPPQGPPQGPPQAPQNQGLAAMAEGLIKKLRVKKQKTKKQMRKKTHETSKRKKQEKAKKQIRESRKRKKQEKAKKQIRESRKRRKPALRY